MNYKVGAIVICGMLIATNASCGFKSDLYLPGQQQKIEQYDSRSLKDIGDEKLRLLQLQKDDSESNIVPNEQSDAIESPDNNSTDASPVLPDVGVTVELPTADEIAREKAKIRKQSE